MRITTKKLTLMSLLTAVALIVFIIEAQIPLPVPIPGAKLGLANTITLFALFYGKTNSPSEKGDAMPPSRTKGVPQSGGGCPPHPPSISLTTANVFMILVCRIILGAAFTGRVVAFIYSISGGLLSFAAMAAMKRFVTEKQIWACGAVGAVSHNIGQIIAAVAITGTPSIAAYLPLLVIAGIITGIVTGLVAQFTIMRLTSQSNKQ